MAVTTVITIISQQTASELTERFAPSTTKPQEAIIGLRDYLNATLAGAREASFDIQIAEGNAVAASGTVTFSGVGAANDTILINGVTFTAKASGAIGNQWNVGADATASAAALAASINASASALVSGSVSASALAGVVTLTAKAKGALGNSVTTAEGVDSTTAMVVSGARLVGGSNATPNVYTP